MTLDTIYNEDCLEGMKQIPDGTIDAVICDLPYGTMKGLGSALKGWDDSTAVRMGRHHTDGQLFAEYECYGVVVSQSYSAKSHIPTTYEV